MGILDRIAGALALTPNNSMSIASPWRSNEDSHLATIVARDIFGRNTDGPLTRDSAIRLPAVARARGLIVSSVARIPIVAETADRDATPADPPAWLTDTSGPISPYHRMLWTMDDLFFYGWSLWAVERDATGAVITAARVAYDSWAVDAKGQVLVDGDAVAADSVVLIPGVTEGMLIHGADTLRQSSRLANAAARAAENPAAQVELHQTNDSPMTETQIDKLIARWSKARRGDNGGVAFTSSGIEVKEHGASNEHLLIEGRNAAAVDVARHAGIPATMIDATLSGSSISYQNTAARMAELVTFGLAPIMAALAARLSLDDVTPPGVTLRFDTGTTLASLADLGAGADDPAPEVVPPAPPRTTQPEEVENNG